MRLGIPFSVVATILFSFSFGGCVVVRLGVRDRPVEVGYEEIRSV